MDITDSLKGRMYPKDVKEGAYLAARADTGQVYLGQVKNTDSGKRFFRYTVNLYAESVSAVEISSDPLSHYILLNEVR